MHDYKDAHGTEIPQHLNAESTSFMLGRKIDAHHDFSLYYDNYDADTMWSNSNKNLLLRNYGFVKMTSWRGVLNSEFGERWQNRFTLLDSDFSNLYNDITTKSIGDQLTWTDDANTVTGGFEWRQDRVHHMNGVKLTNMSYFIQDAWQFAPNWTLTPGLRLDHHSAFGSHTSPHISLAYEFNDCTNAYLSYNEYFVAPSATHLYSTTYGNPAMKPETGHAWEAGVNHQFSDTFAGHLSYFVRESTDKIGYDMLTNKYANFDTEDAHGLNLDLRKQFTKELSGRFGYTYTHVDSTPQRAANVDGYVPKHAVVFGLDYDRTAWDLHLDVRGNIDRKGPQTSDVAALPDNSFFPKTTYWITDISANYHATKNLTIFGRVNNLFDVFYAEQSNARSNWWGQPNECWTVPGRNYQLGVELKF